MPSNPFHWLEESLAQLDRDDLRRSLAVRSGPQRGERIVIDGRELINFGSNDYLGLADDPILLDAAREVLADSGWGAGASPLVTGRGALHARLEQRLADFEHAQAALLFPTGFAANGGVTAALVGRGDAIFSDAKNHASIIDGCRLSGAAVHVYRHADAENLAELLARHTAGAKRCLIVTDGLFSMDGDLPPLGDIARLAEQYGAMLVVDEAHATGVLGQHGRGACEHFGVDVSSIVRVGTLSKALGSVGGFVAGPRSVIDWLTNRARPYIFSTAQPEATAAAALAAIDVVEQQPHRRRELLERAAHLRLRLLRLGLKLESTADPSHAHSFPTQIIPVLLGDPQRAVVASAELRTRGIFVPAIRPPSVPEGESLLRISLTWRHHDQHLDALVDAFSDLRPVLSQPAV